MQFILAILIYPILFIAKGKVTNKSKCSFGIQQKFYLPERLSAQEFFYLLCGVCLEYLKLSICRKLRISLDTGV